MSVVKEDRPVGILTTEKRQYTTQEPNQPPMTEVGIRSTFTEDLYLILSAMDDAQAAVGGDASAQGIDLQVLVKPLVNWIWLGCLILVGGTIIALWPSVDRKRVAAQAGAEEAGATAAAGAAG